MDFISKFNIHQDLINLGMIVGLSLLIGLSQRKLHSDKEKKIFGTDRTFTFIGLLSFILYAIDKDGLWLYIIGFVLLSGFLGVFYYSKIKAFGSFGLTSVFIALITYSLVPIIYNEPRWLTLLIVVIILIFTELKDSFVRISKSFENDEFITLGKFLFIAGVILPILPDIPVVDFLNITPYRVWLAVVVISSISYLSYILKKFIFKDAGILVSGILGGLYSSTATTLVLAKLSKNDIKYHNRYAGAIIIATSMMYLRICLLTLIFNLSLARLITPFLLALTLISFIVGWYIYKYKDVVNYAGDADVNQIKTSHNPLELNVAFVFTLLYIFFTVITYFSIKNYGVGGLYVLSFIVGVSDIDPFLLNLFQGKHSVALIMIAIATMQATLSNNFLKVLYSSIFGNKTVSTLIYKGFIIIVLANILSIALLFFLF